MKKKTFFNVLYNQNELWNVRYAQIGPICILYFRIWTGLKTYDRSSMKNKKQASIPCSLHAKSQFLVESNVHSSLSNSDTSSRPISWKFVQLGIDSDTSTDCASYTDNS